MSEEPNELLRELSRLFNYREDDSRQFTRQQMVTALAHGMRLGSGMEPRENPRQPIFRNHDCGGCNNGERPCREGNYTCCSYPRARND